MAAPTPFLRSFAQKLPRGFTQCHQCMRNEFIAASRSGSSRSAASPARWLNTYRSAFQQASQGQKQIPTPFTKRPLLATFRNSPFRHFNRLFSEGAAPKSKGGQTSSWPDVSDKKVAYWLLGSAASVFSIIIFGGLTRLTESGLSITEWRPVTGSIPPMNQADWESEFAKYKNSPEYHQLNPDMDLQEFKFIYYMEWIHRLWGRFIGITVVLPSIYFVAKRKVSKPMAWKLGGIAGLLGFQGFIGWWMVASGLVDDLFAPGSHPRVSQYRLTTHLGAAFVLYSAMLYSGLSILRAHRLVKLPAPSMKALGSLASPRMRTFRYSVAALAVLTFITSLSGGLVAGLDAGLIYNEFPFMGTGLSPPKKELFDPHYSRKEDKSDLWWRNCLENPSLVQLNHRILAITTFIACCGLFAYTRTPLMKRILPPAARKGAHGVLGFATLQATLGISTLLYLVPIPLASMHQAGSLLLLTWVLVLGSRVWHPTRTAKLLELALKRQRPIRVAGVSPLASPVKKNTRKASQLA